MKKIAKELEKRDQNFNDKIDTLNELLQKISQAFDDKEDFSSYSNERKKALGVEAQS